MPPIAPLYELQQLDTRLVRQEAALVALDDGTGLRAQVAEAATAEEAARADLHAKQARLRDLELELQSTVGKSTKVEQDLYSGRVSNPKELQAMQEDVQALGRQRQRIEDEMLSLMEEVEALLAHLRDLEVQRQTRERALDEHLEDYRARGASLSAEIATLRQQREARAAEIEQALLARYERLRGRKQGVAVAAVVRGTCEACHVAVPEALVSAVRDGGALRTCEECGRILYVEG